LPSKDFVNALKYILEEERDFRLEFGAIWAYWLASDDRLMIHDEWLRAYEWAHRGNNRLDVLPDLPHNARH
jgi:hypothetical protein